MSDSPSKYNLNNLWSTTSDDKNCTLSLSFYNATPQLVVWDKTKAERKPVYSMKIRPNMLVSMLDKLPAVLTLSPGTSGTGLSYVTLTYNPDTKTYEKGPSIVFYKNETSLITIEVFTRPGVAPIRFVLKAPNNFSLGGESLSDATRSELAYTVFLNVLNECKSLYLGIARFNYEPPKPAAATAPSDDNSFFG